MIFSRLTFLAVFGVGMALTLNAQQPSSAGGIIGTAGSAKAPLVFSGVNVVDVTDGHIVTHQNVVVVGSRITAIGSAKKVPAPKGAIIIDAKGKYMIPGMWDMHVHVDQYANQLYPLFVANGVTGLREMAQRFPHGVDSFYKWQGEVLAGTKVGPRVIGPSADLTYNMILRTPEDARRIMDSLKAAKVQFVKFHDSGMRDANLVFAILREARRVGLPVVGHVSRFMKNSDVADSGQLSVEHIEENAQCWPNWPKLLGDSATADARCKPMIDAYIRNGTYMMVGLNGHWLDDQYRPDKETGLWNDEKRFVRMLHRMGFRRFLTGTDWAPIFADWDQRFRAGLSAVEDLVTLNIDAGLPALEALQAGTLNPAKMFGMTDSLGTVSVGKLADLALIDGNPLENIRNVLNVRGVVVNGFYYNHEQLVAMDPIGTQPDQGLIAAREGRSNVPAKPTVAQNPQAQQGNAPKTLADTAQLVLTADDIAHMLTFLRATVNEWKKPDVSAFMQAHVVLYPIEIGRIGGAVPPQFQNGNGRMPVADMAALFESMASIKQALTQATLTGTRYMQIHRAILNASLTDQLDRLMHKGTASVTDTTTTIGKNVQFLRANPSVVTDLRAVGLELPELQAQRQ